MKISAFGEGKWYKGNVHTHTTLSDGKYSPQEVAKLYKKAGYDFVAMTEHMVFHRHNELTDNKFIVLPGVEMHVEFLKRPETYHHIVGILPENCNLEDNQRLTPKIWKNKNDTQELIDFINNNGGLAIYAHPYWSRISMEELGELKNLFGLEIFNYGCEYENNTGYNDAYYEYLLCNGEKVYCFATDDTHQHTKDYCGGWIIVKTEDFSRDGIIESIKKGCFYASEGPEFLDLYVEDGTVYVKCSPCRQIAVMGYINRGGCMNDEHGNLTEFTMKYKENCEYIRVVITDRFGKKAWSQPIWVK